MREIISRTSLAVVLGLASGSAMAFPIHIGDIKIDNLGLGVFEGVDPTSLVMPEVSETTGNVAQGSIGSQGGQDTPYVNIFDLENKAEYTAVKKNPLGDGKLGTSSATYKFAEGSQLFFLWGSADEEPEDRNVVEFFLGGVSKGVVTALDIAELIDPDGDPSNFGRGYLSFTAKENTDWSFDTVVFSNSSVNAFEYGALSTTAIPLPAAGWLLLGAAGLVGAMKRREKKAV